MNKRLMILAVIVIIGCLAAGFVVNGFGGNYQASAESQKDHIKNSMEETKKWKENLQKFHEEATKLMEKKGYDVRLSSSGGFYSSRPPEVIAQGNKEELTKHGKEIKQLLQNLVNKYDLGEMAIRLEVQHHQNISRKDKKLVEQSHEIMDLIQLILRQKSTGSYTSEIYARSPRTIKIKILQPSADFNTVKKDLEKQIHDAIYEKKHLNYTVKVTKQTASEIRDMKWHPIFDAIMEETDKEFDEYKGFGYSFHPMPLQIVIKTSLSKGSKARAEKIEQYVKQVIEIKTEELSVEKVPYKVIIRGKGNKQVN